MQVPKLPSFFKATNAKYFSFKPRYYCEKKERREQLLKEEKSSLKFKRNNLKFPPQKVRKFRILFLIIILSLLAYKLIIT
tara:strand:- start:3 stop:242 length:240 start_codon:yes stop_codon:yes gene_type:complete